MSEKIGKNFEEEKNFEGKKTEYNFELMEEIEPAMISLASQMKEDIEQGRWSSLLSDETGGRIPTLVLRKILKEKGPDKNIQAYFLSAGQKMPGCKDPDEEFGSTPHIENEEGYKKVKKYLAGLNFGNERILIVTEYIFHSTTLQKIGFAMDDARVENKFDFAIVHNSGLSDTKRLDFFKKFNETEIFIGEENYNSRFAEENTELGGVEKTREYSPVPITLSKKIKETGRQVGIEEFNKIFGILERDGSADVLRKIKNPKKSKKYEDMRNAPLTPKEEQKIQEKINLAREDVDKMAGKVMQQVWK